MVQGSILSRRGTLRFVVLLAFVVAALVASTWGSHPAAAAQNVKAMHPNLVAMSADSHGCPLDAFCAYSGTGFTGTRIVAVNCGQAVSIPFIGAGSWDNNQNSSLGPTRVSLRNSSGATILTTASAHSELQIFDWTDIFTVVPC
jgi:hypothetical protein